ncbi:EAL domain-containing protein [Serratia fonticola]
MLAEGVENDQTVKILRGLGCDEVQGYVFSRPLKPGDLEAWYQARNKSRTEH